MTSTRRIEGQRRDWDEVAGFNPEWAVLTTPDQKHEGWDMEPFFASGTAQIDEALAAGAELGLPAAKGSVLDFGCGVGRLAPALSQEFDRYTGVDISRVMVERARGLHAERANCEFVVNEADDLSRFDDASFDAVTSFLVLQHMTSRAMIRSYLAELARVLVPGGLIAIQVITHVPLVYRFRLRRKLYRVARALGVSVARAHRWGLQSMVITAIGVDEVRELFAERGADVRRDETVTAAQGVRSTTLYVTKPMI